MTQYPSTTLTQLIESLPSGSSSKEIAQIRKAYHFVKKAHADKQRKTKELYVEHDLAVAHIISQLGVDISAITAGLLHDCLLPHTGITAELIQAEFHDEITNLVTGLESLDPFIDSHERDKDTKAMEAIINTIIEGDSRIILIFLADKLQELRKSSKLPPNQQLQIAGEARDLYAPLANRLGIWQLKWELEDLAFRFLEPEQFRFIADQLDEKRAARNQSIKEAVDKLSAKIREGDIQASVTGRPKHIYSIYRKMKKKEVDIAHIYDVRALRVIIHDNDPNLCYQVLGIVHNLWQPIPHEFDDYIARSKSNGYQSLHTAVIDGKGQTLEVQIRTREMHEEAEKGIAAHWAYKEGGRLKSQTNQRIQHLRQILTSLQDSEGSRADGASFKTEFLGERIYVFTPKGDIIDLPSGATPIDFAYGIHTEVGHRCRGARVNGKMVSLDYRLKSGQQVDIITANKGGPNRDWMNENLGYTAASRTRSKIRGWFRQQEKEKNISQGREVVNRELRRLAVNDVYTIEDIATALKFKDIDSFLAKVGFGDIQSTQIGGAISALQQKLQPDDDLRPLLTIKPRSKTLTVKGIAGLHTKMAGCCTPIPPEPIMGYITRGRGVTIHKKDCKTLIATAEPERWIDVEWGIEEETYPIPIVVKAYRRPGLIDEIANILNGQNINLAKTKTNTSNSISTIYMVAEVTSLDQLNHVLSKFEKLNNVIEAGRQNWA
jgi:GTP pyrophosphokinase